MNGALDSIWCKGTGCSIWLDMLFQNPDDAYYGVWSKQNPKLESVHAFNKLSEDIYFIGVSLQIFAWKANTNFSSAIREEDLLGLLHLFYLQQLFLFCSNIFIFAATISTICSIIFYLKEYLFLICSNSFYLHRAQCLIWGWPFFMQWPLWATVIMNRLSPWELVSSCNFQ